MLKLLARGLPGARPKPIGFRPSRDRTPVDWSEVLPYAGDPVDDTVIDRFGGVHSFYDVRFPHPESMSKEALEGLSDRLSRIFCRMPDGIVQTAFHWTANGDFEEDLRSAEEHAAAAAGLRADTLARIRIRIAKRKLSSVSLVCALCARPKRADDEKPTITRKLSGSGSEYVIPRKISREEWRKSVEILETAQTVFVQTAFEAGGSVRRLSAGELASHLYRLLNPDLAIDYRVPFPGGPFLSSFLCSPAHLLPDALRWGEYHHGIVILAQLPRKTKPSDADFLASLLPFRDYRIAAIFRRRPPTEAAKELLDEISKQEALAPVFGRGWLDTILGAGMDQDIVEKMERSKRIEGNPEYRARIDEAKALHKDILSGKEEALTMQWLIHLWHRDLSELRRRRAIILSTLGHLGQAKGWSYGPDGLLQAFLSSLPGAYAPLVYPQRCPSRVAADLTPTARGLRSGEKAVTLLESGGGLLAIDPFSTRNVHAPIHGVSGQTGAGKSVLLGKLALDAHKKDGTLVIIERGWSYEAVIGLFGGQTIRFDANRPMCLNPLEAFAERTGVEPGPGEIEAIEQAVTALLAAAGAAPENSDERLRLRSCLEQAFASARGKARADMTCLLRVMRRVEGAERMASAIRLFTMEGPYGAWFDGPTQLSLRSKAVYFDLSGLIRAEDLEDQTRDKTLGKAYISLLALLARKLLLAPSISSKLLLFGEFWSFLKDPVLSGLILEAMKTYRKEGVAVFAETQSLRDLRRSEGVGAAIEQSVHTWFLLDQGPLPEIEQASAFLSLTDGEREILQTLRSGAGTDPDGEPVLYREALLVRGLGRERLSGRVRVRLEPEERWLLTTEPDERPLRQRMIEECGGDVERAIRALAAKYPCGYRS